MSSLIDFKQEAQYQGCLHIAVTALEELNSSFYVAVYERLCSLPPVQLSGTVLFLRFMKAPEELPAWAMGARGPKWDEFEAHKQIVGLLGITQCSDVDELTNAKASLRAAAAEYKPNLLEARCLIYGPKKQLEACRDLGAGMCLMNFPLERDIYKVEDINVVELEEVVKEFAQDVYNRLNGKIGMIEKMLSSTGRSEVLTLKSPFESREVGMQEEDSSDTRPLSRSHIIFRMEKHLGDLYLLTGQLQQASAHYRNALPSLKSFKDWLWAGSIHEALSVTAIITKECEEVLGQKAHGTAISGTSNIFRKYTQRVNPVAGISSLTARSSASLDNRRKLPADKLASDPNLARLTKYTTTRKSSTKSAPSDLSRNESDEGLVMKNPSAQSTITPPPPLEEVDEDSGLLDIGDETDGVMESIQYEVEADGEGEGDGDGEGEGEWFIDSRLLQKDFIAKQYSLALFTFKKAGDPGGVCQVEALLKFARYLAKQKKCVKAAETLQRILKIDSRLIAYQDRIDLYITMAEVYQSMNFHRKAAMFTHYAARCVIEQAAQLHTNKVELQKQNHNLVYHANTLLVNCLPGFKLSSNLEDLPKQTAAHIGWPVLQAHVLKDFVYTSRELQRDIEAINHSCYLLQVLHQYLSKTDLQDMTNMLADIIQEAHDKAKVNPTFAASMAGKLVSPLPLLNFPLVHSFQPKPLVPHHNPYRMKGFTSPMATDGKRDNGKGGGGGGGGPFIYTPIGKKKKENRPEVVWVEEEPGEIAVEIVNLLPFDLKVERMTVLLEGIKTEMYPSTLVLPPGEPQSFVLACIPKEPGLLSILGYKTVVFGVDNQCTVKIPGDPVVRVVPQLPQLRVKVLPSMDSGIELEGGKGDVGTNNGLRRKMSRASIDKFELMDGESCQCDFLLESSKQLIDIESLAVSLKDYNKDYCQFSFDQDYINSLLPITKSKIVSFTVTVLAKIPPWFRVMNDATTSFSRKAVGLFDCSSQGSLCTPECSLKSEFHLSSGNSTPNSSPTPKRTRGAAHALLPFKVSTTKQKSSDSAYSSYNQDSMTLESLDLHIPHKPSQQSSTSSSQGNSPTRSINSLGRSSKPPKTGHKRGPVDDVEAALDSYFISMDSKRASIRSDPGDREESKLSRFMFKKGTTPFTHSETKPVAIPKSETAAARLSDLSNGGSPMYFAGGGGGGPSYQASLASGVLFGADNKTQSLVRGLKSSGNKGKWQPSPSARYISNPIGPLYRENPRPPSKVKIVGEFSLEYSGGQGLQEGFCREFRTNLQIIVKPVLTFEQFDVSLVEGSQSLFKLSFTMTNISRSRLNITCKINQDGLVECGGMTEYKDTLDPNISLEMSVAIKRFVVIEPPGSIRTESNTAKFYSERLSQMIQFNWQEATKRKQGVITLEGLRLATSFISLMRPVPLRFEVCMNGGSCVSKGQNNISRDLKVGEAVKVSLTLINNSGLPMPASYLVLDPYQFSRELKRIVKDLRGKMVVTSCFVIKIPELEPDNFYVHEVTLVFLQRGEFQLDIKSMTPSNDNQGGAEDPHRLSSRTSSGNEAVLSRSPIRKVSQQSNKNRPSLNEKLSVDKKGNKSENSHRSSHSSAGNQSSDGGGQFSKEKNLSQNSKNLPTVLQKKPKPPVASQGAGSNKRPVSGGESKEDTNSRTSSTGDDPSSILPSAYVARMVSMIERRGTPPPVPTSARPKLKPMEMNIDHQPVDPSAMTGNGNQFTKKLYPTINGSSALAKPVPLSQSLNSSSNSRSGNPSSLRSTFTTRMEERQEGEQAFQDESSTAATTTASASKGTKSSTKHKRLSPERMESVILLSSNSRSQNLWNARLQSSVRLLSGPHFTFNVT